MPLAVLLALQSIAKEMANKRSAIANLFREQLGNRCKITCIAIAAVPPGMLKTALHWLPRQHFSAAP